MGLPCAAEYELAGGREHAGPGLRIQVIIPERARPVLRLGRARRVAGIFGQNLYGTLPMYDCLGCTLSPLL